MFTQMNRVSRDRERAKKKRWEQAAIYKLTTHSELAHTLNLASTFRIQQHMVLNNSLTLVGFWIANFYRCYRLCTRWPITFFFSSPFLGTDDEATQFFVQQRIATRRKKTFLIWLVNCFFFLHLFVVVHAGLLFPGHWTSSRQAYAAPIYWNFGIPGNKFSHDCYCYRLVSQITNADTFSWWDLLRFRVFVAIICFSFCEQNFFFRSTIDIYYTCWQCDIHLNKFSIYYWWHTHTTITTLHIKSNNSHV